MKRISMIVVGLISFFAVAFVYLDRPLPEDIQPASFTCLSEGDGQFLEEDLPVSSIYGIGLAYADHINETASSFNVSEGPPVFKKAVSSMNRYQSKVAIPASEELVEALEEIETGIGQTLSTATSELEVLLDYEVELGFVLLEPISDEQLRTPGFAPKIGFLIANDVSARSVAILGEGQSNRYDYWGASKSFPGFTPVSDTLWVPEQHLVDGIPCVILQTYVNGVLRQSEVTDNLIYRPKEMLYFIRQAYPEAELKRGDLILTGTPGGVIFNVPRWKSRLAELLGLDRFQKLALAQRPSNTERFLKPGDQIRVSGQWLGEVNITLH